MRKKKTAYFTRFSHHGNDPQYLHLLLLGFRFLEAYIFLLQAEQSVFFAKRQ